MGAFFFRELLRNPRKKNRAFRCNSSDLPMQILWDFRFNPWRAQGLTRAGKPRALFAATRPNAAPGFPPRFPANRPGA
jgi:hypothetical protein